MESSRCDPLRLWIESAHQSLIQVGEAVCGDTARTFQDEEQFSAVLVCSPQGGAEGKAKTTLVADKAACMLRQGASPDAVADAVLTALPPGRHVPFSLLQVLGGRQAHLVECNIPPLFLIQGGHVSLLPVLEETSHGRLIRECEFLLRDGDHAAMVSEGFLHPRGWRWGWGDVAVAVRRWADTRCDADELLGALLRTYGRLNPGPSRYDVTVIALHSRPMHTATVWTGPPMDPAQDQAALDELMSEQGTRIICGDTTAEIAARLLGADLEMEPRPEDGWQEVPPTSRLDGVDLVTEGLVTLGKARERMAGVRRVRDVPAWGDGATRLARALLAADQSRFLVGLAVNPAQTADAAQTIPLRRVVVERLIHDLTMKGKLASVEYLQ